MKPIRSKSLYLEHDDELANWDNYQLLLEAIFEKGGIERLEKMKRAREEWESRRPKLRIERGLKNMSKTDRKAYFKEYYEKFVKPDILKMEIRRIRTKEMHNKLDNDFK